VVAQNVSAQTAVEDVLLAAAEPLISVGYLGPVLALYPHLRAVTEAGQVRADIQTARLNMVLGRALHLLGDYAGAQPAYERSLALRERGLGPEHPEVAACLNNVAALYQAQGRYAAAEPLYQRALASMERGLGPGHPDVAACLNNLAMLYHARGGYAAAEPLSNW
jgi:tetratricopeptide (TPR) repeat protein